jgi:TonB family protein
MTVPAFAQQTSAPIDPSWQINVVQQLQRFKRFPAEAASHREQGVVRLSFSLDRNGHVLTHNIARSSGYPDLDNEAVAMIMWAEPFPPFPASMPQASIDLVVPIVFKPEMPPGTTTGKQAAQQDEAEAQRAKAERTAVLQRDSGSIIGLVVVGTAIGFWVLLIVFYTYVSIKWIRRGGAKRAVGVVLLGGLVGYIYWMALDPAGHFGISILGVILLPICALLFFNQLTRRKHLNWADYNGRTGSELDRMRRNGWNG